MQSRHAGLCCQQICKLVNDQASQCAREATSHCGMCSTKQDEASTGGSLQVHHLTAVEVTESTKDLLEHGPDKILGNRHATGKMLPACKAGTALTSSFTIHA